MAWTIEQAQGEARRTDARGMTAQRTLVHGDYTASTTCYVRPRDGRECLAVLDWELSTTGHPYADLAAVIMQWQMPSTSEGRGLQGIDRAALGLPTDGEFIGAYCKRRGIGEIDNFGFYLAFNFFRMAAIIQGVSETRARWQRVEPRARQTDGPIRARLRQCGPASLARRIAQMASISPRS